MDATLRKWEANDRDPLDQFRGVSVAVDVLLSACDAIAAECMDLRAAGVQWSDDGGKTWQ